MFVFLQKAIPQNVWKSTDGSFGQNIIVLFLENLSLFGPHNQFLQIRLVMTAGFISIEVATTAVQTFERSALQHVGVQTKHLSLNPSVKQPCKRYGSLNNSKRGASFLLPHIHFCFFQMLLHSPSGYLR